MITDLLLVPILAAVLALELDNRFRLGRLLQWTEDHNQRHDRPENNPGD